MSQPALPVFKDVISPKYIFGYNGNFKNNVFLHYEPIKLIYPAGNNIIFYNTDDKTQVFLYPNQGTNSITAMALSQNRRYLAWAEEAEVGIIVVYDLQTGKKKILTSVDSGSRSYISLSFSKDETKGLYSLTGGPEYNMIIWDWTKQKIISSTKLLNPNRVYSCFCHPKEDDLVGIIGNSIFKMYKVLPDDSLKLKDPLMNKKDVKELGHSQNYLSYCLLRDENLIIGTDQGELLLFNNNWEYKSVLNSSPYDGFPIEVMLPYSRGFLVAGVNATIYQYEKHEGDLKIPYIKLDKKIQNREIRSKITSLAFTSGEEFLVIGTEDGHFFKTLFSREASDEKFDPVVHNFHCNRITGLDVCIRKPLLATCSLDKTVRVWNYAEQEHSCEILKEYDEEALSIGFHPSGFHLVVAFSDKIRMMNIFEKDLVTYKEINVKACSEISFSNGGHLFAIANTNIIQVYQFYTGENPPNYVFRGHAGKVVSIVWLENDLGFLSASNDGTVYEYRLEDNSQKLQLMNNTNFQITSIICSLDKYVYVAGIDLRDALPEEKHILEIKYSAKEIKDHENLMIDYGKKYTVSEPVKIFTGTTVSQVTLSKSNKLFFFGTEEKEKPGAIRVARYPFTNEVLEFQTHSHGISKMKVTHDDNFIFTTGNDGCLIIYEIKDKDSKVKKDKENAALETADEFLMPKELYMEKIREIEKLKADIDRQKLTNEIDAKIHQKEKDEKIRQLDETIKRDAESDRLKYESLLKAKEEMQSEYEQKKKQLKEKHEKTKKSIEADYKQKIALEIARFEDLEKEKSKELKEFENYTQEYEEKHIREISNMQTHYEEQLMRDRMLRDTIFGDKEDLLANFNKLSAVLEEKAESRIEVIKEENEEKIKKYRELMEKALAEKNAKKGILDSEAQKLEDQKTKLKEIGEDITQIQDANKQLIKEKEAHEKEIQERDKTIVDKNRRITELQKKTQELEKFKFVLDYKIKELKRNIGPREEEIAKMKEQIANMNAEILHFKRTNDNLWLIVKDLRFRQKGMKLEIEGLEKVIAKNENYIKSYESEVSECYQSIGNFKILKKKMLGLYNKYVQDEKKKLEIAIDLQAEFINQREHLETNVKSLKLKFEKNMEAHLQDNKRIMKENVDLIKEINDLRREMKFLQDDVDKRLSLATSNPKSKRNFLSIEGKEELINSQKEEIIELQEKIREMIAQNQYLREARPVSAQKLPPLDQRQ